MCVGCGSTFLQSTHGKAPDAADAFIWLLGLALWIMILHHFDSRQKQRALDANLFSKKIRIPINNSNQSTL